MKGGDREERERKEGWKGGGNWSEKGSVGQGKGKVEEEGMKERERKWRRREARGRELKGIEERVVLCS